MTTHYAAHKVALSRLRAGPAGARRPLSLVHAAVWDAEDASLTVVGGGAITEPDPVKDETSLQVQTLAWSAGPGPSSPVHRPSHMSERDADPARYRPDRSRSFVPVHFFFSLPPSRAGIVSPSRSVWCSACLTCSGRSYLQRLLPGRSLFDGEALTKDAVKSFGFSSTVQHSHLHIFTLKVPVKIEIHFQMCIPFSFFFLVQEK